MIFERFTNAPIGAITLIDQFAKVRGTRGAFPTVMGGIQFLLVAQILGGNTLTFDPPLRVEARPNPSGVYLFANEVKIDGGPIISFPLGRYRLLIESDFYQSLEQDLDFPLDFANMPVFDLLPGPAYPFPDLTPKQNRLTLLRGSLFETGGGRPIAGATVTITASADDWSFKSCLTGKTGDWVLATSLDPTEQPRALRLRFTLPDESSFEVENVVVRPGADNSLPQTALRGSVLDARGTPIPRSIISVSAQPGNSITAANGQWFFYLSMLQPDTQARVTARVPDGRTQEQDVQIRSRATVVVPTFELP